MTIESYNMRDFQNGKRIGFILGTIHSGSALSLWHKLAKKVGKKSGSFFIFPGGKLDKQTEAGKLRNNIYSLVNSDNLDGLISWASSISGAVSSSELEVFHNQFEKIPYVTIGQKINGRPLVSFDAYTGMKELVRHFINVHNSRKIAFIRAPATHTSAADRYRGYLDAMAEAGLATSEDTLISDNFSWYEGENAIKQICEERGLVPGKDFDTVIASSDLMAIAVEKYLRKIGVRIPKDVMVGAFNDSLESRTTSPALSTVHMPHSELGYQAYDCISDRLEGKTGVEDYKLPTYAVIRESCGCNTLRSWVHGDSKTKLKNRQQLYEELAKTFHLSLEAVHGIFDNSIDALQENDRSKFLDLVSVEIERYFESGGDVAKVVSGVNILKNITFVSEDFLERVTKYLFHLIPKVYEKVSFLKRHRTEEFNTVLSTMQNELLSVHSRSELASVLKKHLYPVGMKTVAIILREDSEYSRFIGGYNESGEMYTEQVRFPANLIVPEKYSNDYKQGVFVVQPLFVEGKDYGYIITGYAPCEGVVYENLRVAVSSAIQSILLFEQISEAKRTAENAEFEKTEFFANVGSDLIDPLKDLASKIKQMEININNGFLDEEILSEQLLFLRSQIQSQVEKTETLIDLTKSQVDDLPMDKKLFDIRQVLPGKTAVGLDREIPLLYGDSERLKKALQTIFDFSEKEPYIVEKEDGIHIEFYGLRFDWEKPELLLAEKILLLQYAIIEKSESFVEVVLAWPNLAGLPPYGSLTSNYRIVGLSEKEKRNSIFEKKVDLISKQNEDITSLQDMLLYWEPDEAPIDEWVKIYGLRKNSNVFRAPVLCFSRNLIGHNFVEILEQKIRAQKVAPVLFVNAKHTRYGTWATDSNTVNIPSMSEFDKILEEITPSLIVFESIDEPTIKKIRQNQKTVLVPIIVLPDTIESEEQIELLCSHPRIILCNRGAAESEQFNDRIKKILAGDEILPPHTGALVKKAILYLNKNASQQIVRWKLADTVHVSEDYLTRIFHKEIGLSLWEYLNRYRIYIATKMLLETNDTIYEIAENSGFQDQAYFCRVFKKIYGVPPGKIRSK